MELAQLTSSDCANWKKLFLPVRRPADCADGAFALYLSLRKADLGLERREASALLTPGENEVWSLRRLVVQYGLGLLAGGLEIRELADRIVRLSLALVVSPHAHLPQHAKDKELHCKPGGRNLVHQNIPAG